MTINPEKVQKWLRDQISDLTPEGPITRIELWHATVMSHSGDAQGDRLLHGPVRDDSDVVDMVTEVLETAERDAETRTSGMPQRYVLATYRGALEDRHELNAQFPFTLLGGSQSNSPHFGDSYPPTEVGMRAQSMSQVESMHRLLFTQTQYLSETSRQDVERYRKRLVHLEDRNLELMNIQEELLDRRQERDLRQAEAEARARRIDKIAEMGLKFLPIIAAQMLGKGAAGAPAARDTALHEFLKGLNEQEVMGILEALPPEKQATVMQLYQAHAAEEKVEQEEKHPLLRDHSEVH